MPPPPPSRCALPDHPDSGWWPALLSLRAHLAGASGGVGRACLARRGDAWAFHPDSASAAGADAVLHLAALDGAVDGPTANGRHPDLPPPFAIYLPIVLGAWRAQRAGRVFVTGHLAQTLDGRIACRNGESQWIGNEANLRHAHRLRALHDAVLVGGRTVERDNPQLTVRHVPGDNPRRIVCNGSGSTLRSSRRLHVFDPPGCTVVCAGDGPASAYPSRPDVEILPLAAPAGQWIAPIHVLAALRARGVRSLFVEGGGTTLSHFLQHGCMDLLHLHIAPVILGSGIAGLTLPEVGSIGAALRVHAEHFSLDGELLLACRTGDNGA